MPNMQERLNAAVDMAEVDTGLLHDMVHGDENKTVPTENGLVPSIAKIIKDIRNAITGKTTDLVERAESAAATATTKKEECAQIKTDVQTLLGLAEQAIQKVKIWVQGTDEEVAAEGGLHSCKTWVELAQKETIGSYPSTLSGVATEGQTVLPLEMMILESDQILSVMVENVSLMPDTYKLTEDRKAVQLNYPLSKGERWSVKYLTEFQSLSSLAGTIYYEDMEVV